MIPARLCRLPAWATALIQTVLTLLSVAEEAGRLHIVETLEYVCRLLRRQWNLEPVGDISDLGELDFDLEDGGPRTISWERRCEAARAC